MKIVEIEWYPRLSVAIDQVSWEYSIADIPAACLNRSGFYCIYGRHPVYGPDVLLYIGETKSNSASSRDLAKRIREHFKGRFWYHTDLTVSLGIPAKELSDFEVQAVESLLIAAHKPALNRTHIDEALASAKNYLVQNYGFLRSLVTECSGAYWCE